jgi:hypothetical protein
MQMLNRYFSPFALIMILSAIYFSEPEPKDTKLSLAILAASIIVNWYLSANTYHFIRWARQMRVLQIWLNFVWAAPLVYLLVPYWAPVWLLFAMAPVTAALYMTWWHTFGTALISAGAMLLVYHLRNPMALEGATLGMALVHAAFIVVFSLFVNSLAQAAIRLRDAKV